MRSRSFSCWHGGCYWWSEPSNRKKSMHTLTEQPPSSNPEAPPERWLRREQVIVVAEGAFCAALALVGVFLLHGPDGPFDPAAFRERMNAGPSWGHGVLLAALLLGLAAELDLLGRVVAAPLARIVHGRRATPRQSACMRFAAQTAFAALVVIGPLVAPTVFPSFHGWELAAFLVALVLPIGCSIADCQMRCF